MTELSRVPIEEIVGWLAALSAVGILVSAALLPLLVERLPRDYFVGEHRKAFAASDLSPVVRLSFIGMKNV
ncbi:MAG: hypothetical protein KDD69_15650, partial [Bdellovibrionales bacterium]|nr:hypothetical protein [Bdellovibrionales bacterium]